MDNKMFCFQCEQTAGCTGCKGRAGVCGKSAVVARLQDELTGALIGLAQALESCPEAVAEVARLVLEALFTTVTNVNFDESTMHAIIDRVKAETARLGGEAADFDVETIWQTDEDTRSLKSLVLFGLRGMAAYAYHAMVLGFTDPNLDAFIAKSLACLGRESSHDILIPLVLDVGKYNLICMELLDRANTTTYGNPSPQTVSFTIEKGPFIVITGHDLYDLKCLLEQTEGTGVNVYTHGEMLPAHGYPELRKYAHLKGNFGTAWHNQQREFDAIPAPILFTTNCLMPPQTELYRSRIYDRSRLLSGAHAHRKRQRLLARHPKSPRTRRLRRRTHDARDQWWHKNRHRICTSRHYRRRRQSRRSRQIGRYSPFLRRRRLRRATNWSQLLHRICSPTPRRHRHPHSGMRQIPLQRHRFRLDRRHSTPPRSRAMQRCLWRHQSRARTCRGFPMHRQRATALARALVVRTKSRLRLAHTALPRHRKHPHRAFASGVHFAQYPQFPRQKVQNCPHLAPEADIKTLMRTA